MSAGRLLTGVVGCAVMACGGWLLLERQDGEQLTSAAVWLAGGVVAHDLVLAPLALLVVGALRFLPAPARAPAAVGFVVLATTTLWAVPVLGRFGAVPTDPTHLDRDHWAGWGGIAALVVAGVVVAGVVRARWGRPTNPPG